MRGALRGHSLAPAANHAAPSPPLTTHPWVGILAVLLGAFISTLTGRLSTFGLADIRGAVHAGFDEAAWLTTAQTVAQMLVGPAAGWFGAVYGVRRVLLAGCAVFGAASLALPLSGSLDALIGWQFVSGLGAGTFIPLTIGFVLRNLPPRLWAFGIAAYALNLEFSLHVSASLEAWYIDHASWHWIFWQNVPLAALMALCVWRGAPREPVNRELRRHGDWFGIASASLGLAMLYAALDQGNRLDWLNSGLVVGLLAGGGLLLLAFVAHERTAAAPWLDLGVATSGNLPLLMVLISSLRFVILSTAFVVPQFLGAVQGYRALESGQVLLWIALPQLVIAPLAGLLLRRVDGRAVVTAGFCLVGLSCWLVAQGLTRDWATADFLPSQLMQAVGQTFAVSGLIFFAVLNLRPADALTFGALLQIARLFGGEAGTAFMTTWVRVREQIASQLVGLHVMAGDPAALDRLRAYAGAVAGRSAGPAEANARAAALLGGAVRTQANVLSYIDGFAVIVVGVLGALLLVALLRPAPAHPAGPPPLLRRRQTSGVAGSLPNSTRP